MSKSKLSVYFDTLLISTISCFLIYIWINRRIKNANLSFFICILIYILLFFVIFKHIKNKYNINKLKLSDKKNADNYLLYLTYSTDENNIDFFNKLLKTNHIESNILKNENAYFFINLKSALSANDFHIANNFYQKTNKSIPLIFICTTKTQEFDNLTSNSPISYKIFSYYELYLIMKQYGIFPTDLVIKKNNFSKLKMFKNKSIKSLTKNNFFKFLLSGLSLILISIFIPYSYYYLIFGTVLLIFSIICLFNKNSKNLLNNKCELISYTKKTDA